jgi:hypothetical protein
LEIKQVRQGMLIAVPLACWDVFARMQTQRFAKTLKKIAAHVDLEQFRNSPRGPKKPRPKRSRYPNSGHGTEHGFSNFSVFFVSKWPS